MAKLQLVIFDCDGVMFDSKSANKYYYNSLLEKFQLPPMSSAELEYVHIHNVMDSVRYIFRHYSTVRLDDVHLYRQSLDYGDYLQYINIEPDLKKFLRFLKPHYYTAISTNRTTTLSGLLKVFELEGQFGKVVSAMDVEHPKPHPEALELILAHFSLTADEAVYIGDSMVDREHSAAVGMRLIAFKNPDLPAEYHVNSFMEVVDLPLFQKQ